MSELYVNIDGREIRAQPGQSVLDLARENGIEIPSLCYSPLVEPFGSCGMCLIEVEGVPKLLRSCATEVRDGMIITTQSEQLSRARRMALELLLSDHVGDCRSPCHMACPTGQDAQGYIALLANGHPREALQLIKETLPLPASIGRICPHPCEDECRRELKEEPLAICSLKRYAADQDLGSEEPYLPPTAPDTGQRVAVIGGGPAGLSAAYFSALRGHRPEIFEALPQLGGMLRYGIPEYRLPKRVLDQEIELIGKMGVKFHTQTALGQDFTLESLFRQGFDAVFLALGAQSSRSAGCQGEDEPGVYGGVEFLREVTLSGNVSVGSKVAVIGGGNTAMDAARTALRLGAEEVSVLYRRTREEMPASPIEVEEAEEEGVKLEFLVSPLAIEGNGRAQELHCQGMELGEPDESGRRRPQPVEGSERKVEADTVILAIGQAPSLNGLEDKLSTGRGNTIAVNSDTYQTDLPAVFAGGDVVTGPDIAIQAIAQGKEAAQVIDSYLRGQTRPVRRPFILEREDVPPEEFAEWPEQIREQQPAIPPESRIKDFREFVSGFTPEQAQKEANRCLECGCLDVFECKLKLYSDEYGAQASRLAGEVNLAPEDVHPFLLRDPQKCILCGQCVLTCETIRGAGVLSFVNRGFSVVVNPAFDLPLLESECQACAQCVTNCPTGALTSQTGLPKPGPWELQANESTCGYCSVGCQIAAQTRGELLVEIDPVAESTRDLGNLCRRGRFGYLALREEERIQQPWIRVDGQLQPVSWDEALAHLSKAVTAARASYGAEGAAVFASPRLSNEELYLIQKFARTVLGTNHLNSLTSPQPDPVQQVTGLDASTVSLEDVAASEALLLVGTGDICLTHAIAGLKVLEAHRRGAEVTYLGPGPAPREELFSRNLELPESADTAILEALIAQLLEDRADVLAQNPQLGDLQALRKDLVPFDWDGLAQQTGISREQLQEFNNHWLEAKTGIALYDESLLSPEGAGLLAIWTILTGKVGQPRRGLLNLRRKNNSQGLADWGLQPDRYPGQQSMDPEAAHLLAQVWGEDVPERPGHYPQEVLTGLSNGEIGAILLFAEDPLGSGANNDWEQALSQVPLLVVQDAFWTETARRASIVLPGHTPLETRGTFTSLDRWVQPVQPALTPAAARASWQTLAQIARACGRLWDYPNLHVLWSEMLAVNPLWQLSAFNPASLETGFQWGGPLLFRQGFATTDGTPDLKIPSRAPFYAPNEPAHAEFMQATFSRYLKEQGFHQ